MINIKLLPRDIVLKIYYNIELLNLKEKCLKIWKFKTPKKILLGNFNLTNELRLLKNNFELNINTDINLNLKNFYKYIYSSFKSIYLKDLQIIKLTIKVLKILIYFKNKSINNNNINYNNIKILIDYILYNQDSNFIIDIFLFIIIYYNNNIIKNNYDDNLYKIISFDKFISFDHIY